ncbi:hypothetical protein F0562_010409 [Nyssa sinensis]|uniref:VQ domain-containing protein n=1 Tax=Nyssa sinensis TaxID=561372 RepID=A0A5J5A116_9ASTE|nr:hypothetical protein F0562_010409 [Nyssa sinensis]
MGKKRVSQSSLKITKNDKKQNSLIKVLRPKVYIINSSSFKRLVQELTGNGSPISISSPPPTILQPVDQVPVLEIEDHDYQESNSLELSADSSESVPTPFTVPENSPEISVPTPFTEFESSFTTHQMEFSQYRDIESWLLEMDPFPYYDSFAPRLIRDDI